MKNFQLFILFSFFLLACTNQIGFNVQDHLPNETFEDIVPGSFNSKIKNQKDIKDGEALMRLYYPRRIEPNGEGNEKISINSEALENGITKITLIHDNMLDDSQKSMKLILFANKSDMSWQVQAIKKNWRCWPGRGHENWGTAFCN